MRFMSNLIAACLVFCLIGLLFTPTASAFIEREYTIREVLDACTNIVFGKVKSVDKGRLRGVVTVEKRCQRKKRTQRNQDEFRHGALQTGNLPTKNW